MSEPYHAGQVGIQTQVGERDNAILNGRLIGPAIPVAARPFLKQQSYCALGWRSPAGDVWSSLLTGWPGFASTDDTGSCVSLEFGTSLPLSYPSIAAFGDQDHVGMLFIELATRRRLRVNGTIADRSPTGLRINVFEAYPNCPKYIQRREVSEFIDGPATTAVERGTLLTGELHAWIESADTFFVASAQQDGPVDCSHRGGKPGFVRQTDGALLIPDYPGNSMFGTFGNFAVNPRAGLCFVDFESNRQLQLTGDVQLTLDGVDENGETAGTGRWWSFAPRQWIVAPLSTSMNWRLLDKSPFNP